MKGGISVENTTCSFVEVIGGVTFIVNAKPAEKAKQKKVIVVLAVGRRAVNDFILARQYGFQRKAGFSSGIIVVEVQEDFLKLRLIIKELHKSRRRGTVLDFLLGYDSVDGYQRAFKALLGCKPHSYAKAPSALPLFTPYGVKFRSLWRETDTMQNVNSVFIQLIEKPARKVLIKRGVSASDYMSYCSEVGCEV